MTATLLGEGLSFMKARRPKGTGIAYWDVTPSGNYGEDCNTGHALAEEYLAYIGANPHGGERHSADVHRSRDDRAGQGRALLERRACRLPGRRQPLCDGRRSDGDTTTAGPHAATGVGERQAPVMTALSLMLQVARLRLLVWRILAERAACRTIRRAINWLAPAADN